MRTLASDRTVRVCVVTGAGSAFSAGGDVAFLRARQAERDAEANVREMRAFYARFLALRDLQVPLLAAVNGHAVGAGLCLAVACDWRVAAERAKLGVNFVKLGLSPGMAGEFIFFIYVFI